ncbi:NADH dehydrogenase [ubiquinone] 1 beta subcomplex subunit 7 isoform X2 [Rhineura floridana]|uniref:NADH dehydrogenase [ubiquinone] 1 beta subcomplex subunit 7 isoform X2 n=1 Tax=Rhineura floridana TaxID=261503 RepID=UPI002AC8867D|nr:NADH dehydrogenase [ubiquinone] 1 beta subcomplex subunit 7 isoform X2 [Rhineura floridana]
MASLSARNALLKTQEPCFSLMPTLNPKPRLPSCTHLPGMMIATQQQMNDAQLPMKDRDYCAHYLIKFLKCKRDKFPNIFACKHERHDWDYCEHLDYVMRMKEFERERRLLTRKKRIEQKEKAAAAAAS